MRVAILVTLAFVVVGAVVGSAACPRTNGTSDAGPGATCQVDHDCAAGQLCDTSDNTCKDCDVVLKLPPPHKACLPKCGNSIRVGMPCTQGGGECNNNGNIHSLFCSADHDDTDLEMCTGPCSTDAECGDNAVCIGDPADPNSQKGCVPASCSGEGEGEGEGEGGEGEGEGEGGAQ